jgi:hypothetical protein
MNKKIIIGVILSCFLLLVTPCINSVEYNEIKDNIKQQYSFEKSFINNNKLSSYVGIFNVLFIIYIIFVILYFIEVYEWFISWFDEIEDLNEFIFLILFAFILPIQYLIFTILNIISIIFPPNITVNVNE